MTRTQLPAPASVALAVLFLSCSGPHPVALSTPSPSPPNVAAPEIAPPTGCPNGKMVSDAAQLQSALIAAAPGDAILLAPGNYRGHFLAKASGTSDAAITLCGTRASVLDGGSVKSGYTLYLNGASWWRLMGFAVQGGQKGVVTDHASHVLIYSVLVHDVGDEGIHLRSFSSDNTIDGVTVRSTGLSNAKFGEGIYVGSANSNWCRYTSCRPDQSDRNVIQNSDISHTAAENIDIKEGTSDGQILNNHLSGDGMSPSGASAWVNVKGNDWSVTGNVGRVSIKDGFQVHRVYAGWGNHNVFHHNKAEVDGPGFGFYVQFASLAAIIGCDNVAVGAAQGLTNMSCTP